MLTWSCKITLGWVQPGEWLRYQVYVMRPGRYRIGGQLSAAKPGAKFKLEFAANSASATVAIPPTGSAHRWVISANLTEMELVAGPQEVTLRIGEVNGFNIDWLEFSLVEESVK